MHNFNSIWDCLAVNRAGCQSVWRAMLTAVWLKVLGVSAFIGVFFSAYFYLLSHPQMAPLIVPLSAVDDIIPMQFWAWFPYLSLWFYTALPPILQSNVRQLFYVGASIGLVCFLGLLAFYFFPTATPLLSKPDAENLEWLKGIDAAANACPSMHVAAAVFSAFWLDFMLKSLGFRRVLCWAMGFWCVLIVYSTMATKQHVFLDVIAGLVLGGGGAWLSLAGLRLGVIRRWISNERLIFKTI